jgi:hypothetical protein
MPMSGQPALMPTYDLQRQRHVSLAGRSRALPQDSAQEGHSPCAPSSHGVERAAWVEGVSGAW